MAAKDKATVMTSLHHFKRMFIDDLHGAPRRPFVIKGIDFLMMMDPPIDESGGINGGWFFDNNMPMVVWCQSCDMSMAFTRAYWWADGDTDHIMWTPYCEGCSS